MAIPNYQKFMLPALNYIDKAGPTHKNEVAQAIADILHLTPEERERQLPSSHSTYIVNRTGWAISYMKQAGLVYYPTRGKVAITEAGKNLLKENPSEINHRLLMRYESYQEFIGRNRGDKKDKSSPDENTDSEEQSQTPDEMIDTALKNLNAELESELLDKIRSQSPAFFERLVVDMMIAMGYGGAGELSGETTPLTGDEGIDGIIREDALGLDVIYLQAKRWENPVSRPEIQKFVGALQGKRAKKGVFITTSRFSSEAFEYAKNLDCKVILIDGPTLSKLMIQYNVGVQTIRTVQIKKVDFDYFEAE